MSSFFFCHFSMKVRQRKIDRCGHEIAARFAVSRGLRVIMEIRELLKVALSQSLSSSPARAGRHSKRQQLTRRVLISSSYCLLTTKQRLSSWLCSCKNPRGSALQLYRAALHVSQQSLAEHLFFYKTASKSCFKFIMANTWKYANPPFLYWCFYCIILAVLIDNHLFHKLNLW